MSTRPEKIKLYCEIAAYVCAALFLITKLVAGQLNAGMEVGLELKRSPNSMNHAMDDLVVLVKLKRSDLGRLELKDVQLEVSDPNEPALGSHSVRSAAITKERKAPDATLTDTQSPDGIFLPPGDATQLAFITQVKRNTPVLVDATILAKRTGPWGSKPQWRASAISLPDSPDTSKTPLEGGISSRK